MTTLEDLHNDEEEDQLTPEEQAAADAAAAEKAGGSPREGAVSAEEEEEDGEETAEEIAAREALEAEAEAAGKTVEELQAEKAAAESADDEEEEEEAAPGIEQFLSQYNIVGGMITFEADEEGGEPVQKHFNDLSAEEQFNVLSNLASQGAPNIEEKYGLDQEEIKMLNDIRNSGKSPYEFLNEQAAARVEQLRAMEESTGVDYTSMSDDAITTKWLKDNNPEASEEDIAAELERSKESKFYESQVKTIRDNYVKAQEAETSAVQEQQRRELEEQIEADRAVIATAAANTSHIAGWKLNDNEKNEVLGEILEVNNDGDSKFMVEIFGDPNNLLKAAWLYKNAEERFDELEKYWKKEVANAYQKGKNAGVNGLSSDPINAGEGSGSAGGGKEQPLRQENVKTLDDLHADD